jgi:hypothetical protein
MSAPAVSASMSARERRCPPTAVCHVVRAQRLAPQPRHDLRALALHRRGVEARLAQREPQIIERLVAVVLERTHRAAQIVASGAEAHLDRLAFEPVVERGGVVRAGALVEQARRHIGDAGLVRGVLLGAAEKGEFDGDHRQRVVAHQPGLDAERAHHPLDGHRPRGGRGQRERRADEEGDERARSGAADASGRAHERFSSCRVSLTR